MRQNYIFSDRNSIEGSTTNQWSKVNFKTRYWRSILRIGIVLFLFCSVQLQAQIIVESGTLSADFGVDADVQTNGTWRIYNAAGELQDDMTGSSDDWFKNSPLYPGSGFGVIDASTPLPNPSNNNAFIREMSQPDFSINGGNLWLDAVYIRDPNWAGNNTDFSIFKTGSNKNADNPSTWNILDGSNPQKNDIIDAMGHLRRDGSSFDDDLWAFIGASTRSPDGSAYIDFELYRSELTFDPNTSTLSGLGPDGGHTSWGFTGQGPTWAISRLGDVVISLNFENGGVNIIGHIYVWLKPSDLPGGGIIAANALIPNDFEFRFAIGGNGQPIFESGDGANGFGYAEIELNGSNETVAFASINGINDMVNPNVPGDTPAGPWGTITGPQGSVVPNHPEDTFVEFGLNLTVIGLDQSTVEGEECSALFGGVLIKTRSSASFTSELKDLAGPFPFGNVQEANVEITGENVGCSPNPDPVILTANTNTQGVTYQWYNGDPSNGGTPINGETNMTLQVTAPGIYGVVVTAPGINGPGTGCTSEDIFEVGQLSPEPLIINCPTDPTTMPVCSTQSEIDTALALWFSQFTVMGGENPVTVFTVDGQVVDISTYQLPQFDPCIGGSVTIAISVTDDCEQSDSCESTFTVLPDEEDPTASNPDPVVVECIEDIPDPDITVVDDANDNCGNTTVTHVSDVSDMDPCEPVITRTYRVEDDCENFIEVTQTITVDYTQGVTAPDDEIETVECPADAVDPGAPATVQDACGRDVVPVLIGSTEIPDPVTCEGTIEWRYRYTDCTGATDDWTYTYTVDYTQGVTAPDDEIETVECPADAVDPGAPATVQDACGRDVVPVLIGSTEIPDPVTCEGTVEWRYRYTDCTGATDDWTYTYTVDYTQGVTAPDDEIETVECPADAVDPGAPATVQDACGRDVVPVLIGSTEIPDPVTCEGTVEWRYRYTDCTGATDDWTYTYTVDYTQGVTAPDDEIETVECPADAVDPGAPATVQDACGRDVVPVLIGSTEIPDPVTCEGTVEWRYRYTDCTGATDDWTYTYTVDYTQGVTAPDDEIETVECPADAVDPGAPATVQDACGRDVVPVLIGSTEIPDPVTCEGTIEWRYRYTDCTGATDDWTYTYTVDYTQGVTAPDDEIETVECPADAVDPGAPATVQDACGRDVVPVLIGSTEIPDPVTCEGTVEWRYRYTDCTGATDDWTYTYTVDYTQGVTAPDDEIETVECPADAVDPGAPATVQDACGRDVVPVLIGSTEIPDPVTCEGTVEWRYRYTDCTGATDDWTYTYTVDYTQGVTAPDDEIETVECPADAVDPGAPATVQDACGRDVVPVLIGSTEIPDPVTCEGTVEWRYRYTDCTGATDDWTYTYTVDYTQGVTAPDDEIETVECPADAVDPGAPATVQDACGRDVVPVLIGSTEIPDPVTCEGTVEWRYRYTDCTGATDDWTYTYTVDYTQGVTAPDDEIETVECPADAVDPGAPATVLDACGRDVVPVLIGSTEIPDPVTCEGTVEWRYRYTDCTGATDDWTYTYTVDYTQGVTAPDDEIETVECPADAVDPGAPATVQDACGRDVVPVLIGSTEIPDPVTCEGTVEWRYRYTDCTGATDDWTYTYTVDYTQGVTAPDDEIETVECPADAVDPGAPATVQDACGRDVVPVLIGSTEIPDPVTCEGTIEWRYRYTDCTGATDDWTYTYTIDLTTPPNAGADDGSNVQCAADAVEPTPPSGIMDACGRPIIPTGPVVVTSPDPIICIGTVTYTWTYTDCAGNSDDWVYTYNVEDTMDPEIINLPVVDPICNSDFPSELFADWTDNCADGGTISSGAPVITDFTCYQEAVYTFYVEDDCGNSDTETVVVIREYDQYENCETAFARLSSSNPPSQCFITDPNVDFNRWGWTNYIAVEDTYTMNLYAGAAHCDVSNGAQAGEVIVTYTGGQVTVTYQMLSGYVMTAGHIYIGCEKYPLNNGKPTVAPGKYPYNLGVLDHVYNYTFGPIDVDGPFWIIAHAVTCEETCRCSISDDEGGTQTSSDSIDCTNLVSVNDPYYRDNNVDFTPYPVPFNNEFFIDYSFEYDTDIEIEVFDIQGRLFRKISKIGYTKGTSGTTKIDLEGVPGQVLFVKLKTDRGQVTKKVMSSNFKKKRSNDD